MSKVIHSPAALFQYKKAEANKLGLTVREFEANHVIYENTYGYHHRKKDHVLVNERKQRDKEEREFYEEMEAYHKRLGY